MSGIACNNRRVDSVALYRNRTGNRWQPICPVAVVIDVGQSIGTSLQKNRVLWLSVSIREINRDDQAVHVAAQVNVAA